ncbi:MAG: hypothetical protein IH899_10030 [Planctomycetes bacterium]|nr:hypothetical protein [Planctomycetota bacterium]
MQITLKCFCMLVLTAGLSVLAPLQTTFSADKVDQKKRAATLKALAEVRKKADAIQENLDKLKAREASLQKELDSIEKVAVDKAKASQKEADAINTRAAAAQKALNAIRAKVKAKALAITRQKAEVGKAQASVAAAKKQLKPQQAAAKKAADAKAASDKALEAAKKALADAAAKVKAAAKVVADSQAAIKKSNDTVASGNATIAKSNETIKKTEQEIMGLVPGLNKAEEQYTALSQDVLAKRRAAEKELASIGKFVSFSEKVAPIIAKRCLACHNARTAKGRFNMETYAAVIKGGESGESVEPGDADLSTLYAMVEDGSMPKDSDPLTTAELAAIREWINTGAKLDSGFTPTDRLVSIVPKVPQPNPPESYRVPIPVTAVSFSPDGKTLASSGYHEVILWNAGDGKQLRRITNVAERVYDVEFSSDGQTIAVAAGTPGQLGEVKLFNVADGKLLADLFTTDDSVFAVSYSPDGKRLATAGADRAIRVFDVATRKLLGTIEDHADWVMDIAWAPDGKNLASASRDKTSKVFDMSPAKNPLTGLLDPNSISGDSLVTFNGHGQPVFGVGFSPDGKQVVTSGSDKQIRIWNVTDAKQARAIGGFGNEVFRIQITKDGKIYSCSADKNARLHNLADGKVIRTFSGHADWVYSITFNAAAKKVATGSYDGQIRIWNAEDAKGLVTFTAAPGYKAPEATASASK